MEIQKKKQYREQIVLVRKMAIMNMQKKKKRIHLLMLYEL